MAATSGGFTDMALDPNIILQAGNFKTPDYAQTMELRSQLQMRNAAIQRAQREEQMAQQKMVRLGQIGTQAATGDYAGARTAALQGGDFDVLEHIKGLEGDKRDLIKRRAEAAAPVLYTAGKLPYEQRKAYIAQAADSLTANGWTPDEIAGFDPTDGAIGSMVAQAQSISDIFGREEKAADRAQRAEDNAASRDFARGNAFISAGLMPPGAAGGATVPGGDLVARMLPITVQSESGGDPNAVSPKGARGVMQVMPSTNLDPGFGVKPAADASEAERTRVGQDYLSALVGKYNDPAQAWAAYNAGPGRVDAAIKNGGANWLSMLPKETRDYVKKNVAQLGGAASAAPAGLTPIPGGKLDKPKEAPSGYQWTADGKTLEPIKGGPADPAGAGNKNTTSNRKAEADFRKEFDGLPEVKNFRTIENQGRTILALSKKPSAQNDIAMIFSYMKMLDPTSVVREGEFATAQNAAGVPDQIRNAFNKAQNGQRLNPQQRQEMVKSAREVFLSARETYNNRAEQFRSYATDNGVEPDRVAALHQDKPSGTLSANLPTFTPAQAKAAKAGTRFKTTDGRVMVRQ